MRVSPKYFISPLHKSHLHLGVGAVGNSTGWVISASLREAGSAEDLPNKGVRIGFQVKEPSCKLRRLHRLSEVSALAIVAGSLSEP